MTAKNVWMILGLACIACGGDPDPADGGLADAAGCEACDDGLFCNGPETCVGGTCGAGDSPCASGEVCDEDNDACVVCDAPDIDGDGHDAAVCGGDDCDDQDPSRSPDEAEVCDDDGVDEDCEPSTLGARDQDDDGYVDAACCNGDECGADCNDADASAHPALPDVCGDGVDNDCDGVTDEGGTLYLDLDNDGRGDPDVSMTGGCTAGYVTNADDCDDANENIYGGGVAARERCDGIDNDCSLPGDMGGGSDPAEDGDDDGHAPVGLDCIGADDPGANGTELPRDDCDDAAPATYPGATEICGDPADNDCDPSTDSDCICLSDSDCLPLAPERGVCDVSTARCVECTAANDTPCGANSCGSLSNTCTSVPRLSLGPCQRCEADSQCMANHRCVPHEYAGVYVGYYCARLQAGGCVRPYSVPYSGGTSIDGFAGGIFCIPSQTTTCEAVRAALTGQTCPDGRDDTCAPQGAVCRTVGAIANQCTYPCNDPTQCPSGAPRNTCGDSDGSVAAQRFCGGSDI